MSLNEYWWLTSRPWNGCWIRLLCLNSELQACIYHNLVHICCSARHNNLLCAHIHSLLPDRRLTWVVESVKDPVGRRSNFQWEGWTRSRKCFKLCCFLYESVCSYESVQALSQLVTIYLDNLILHWSFFPCFMLRKLILLHLSFKL